MNSRALLLFYPPILLVLIISILSVPLTMMPQTSVAPQTQTPTVTLPKFQFGLADWHDFFWYCQQWLNNYIQWLASGPREIIGSFTSNIQPLIPPAYGYFTPTRVHEAPGQFAAPARINEAHGSWSSGSTFTVTVTAPTNGNTMIAVFEAVGNNSSITLTSVAETGASYSIAKNLVTCATTHCPSNYIEYALNVSGAGTVVTFTVSGTLYSAWAFVAEYSGILTASAFDKSNSATASSGTTVSTGTTATLSLSYELVVAGLVSGIANGFSGTCANSFTSVDKQTGTYMSGEYCEKIVTSTASVSTSDTTGSAEWIGTIASFKGTFTVTVTAPTNGNAMIAVFEAVGNNSSITLTSVAETGASYSLAWNSVSCATTLCPSTYIEYALNVSGAGTVVTFTMSGTLYSAWAFVAEYSGILTASAFDKYSSATASSGTTVSTGTTATLSQSAELAVGSLVSGSASGFSGTCANSFTSVDKQTGTYMSGEYCEKIVTSTAALSTSDTTGSAEWDGAIATFKAGVNSFTRSITQTVTDSPSVKRTLRDQRNPTLTITSGATVGKLAVTIRRSYSQTITNVQSAIRTLAEQRDQAQPLTISSSVSRLVAAATHPLEVLIQTITNTASLVRTVIVQRDPVLTLTSGVTVSRLAESMSRVYSQTVTGVRSLIRTVAGQRANPQTVTSGNAASRLAESLSRSYSQTITNVQSLVRLVAGQRATSQTITSGNVASRLMAAVQRIASQTITNVQSLVRGITGSQRSVSQPTTIGANTNRSLTLIVQVLAATITNVQSVLRTAFGLRSTSQPIASGNTVSRGFASLQRSISNLLAAAVQLIRNLGSSRTLSSGPSITAITAKQTVLQRIASDSIAISGTVWMTWQHYLQAFTRTIASGATVNGSPERMTVLIRISAATLATSVAISRGAVSMQRSLAYVLSAVNQLARSTGHSRVSAQLVTIFSMTLVSRGIAKLERQLLSGLTTLVSPIRSTGMIRTTSDFTSLTSWMNRGVTAATRSITQTLTLAERFIVYLVSTIYSGPKITIGGSWSPSPGLYVFGFIIVALVMVMAFTVKRRRA